MDLVAIAILNWNGKQYLEEFLPSVIKYSNYPDVSIYIIDNGSTDGSVELINTKFPSVHIVQLDKNYGFTGGYNRGLLHISAKYYILLNSDIEATHNWIHPIISVMEKNPDIAACMPKLRAYKQKSFFEYAGAAGGFIDKFGYPFCRGRIFDSIEKDTGQYDTKCSIFWATGAALFINAEKFHEFKGFDEDFFAHMEEIDLCWRLKNHGYKIYFIPEITLYHLGGGTLPKQNPKKVYYNFRNNLLLLYKNVPGKYLPITITMKLILDIIASFHLLIKVNIKSVFMIYKAYFHFIKMVPRMRTKRKNLMQTSVILDHPEIIRRSVVWDYFVRNKKRFSEIVKF